MPSQMVSKLIVLATLLAMGRAQDIPTPTYTGPLNALKKQGCFSSSDPLQDHGSYTFQTSGNCQPICVGLGKPVMALVNGSNCLCGDLLPAKNSQVDDAECNTPCQGFDKETCGGNGRYQVYLSGLNKNNIGNFEPGPSATPKPDDKNKQPPNGNPAEVVTVGGSTVVMTVPPTSTSADASGAQPSGPSKAGIAAGVVAGVVGLAAIVGAVFFFLRYRRRQEVEEEYRRQAAVKEFVNGGRPPNTGHSSLTDARLDPEAMLRRESVGSLADNQDYSRRILKVTNPDGH